MTTEVTAVLIPGTRAVRAALASTLILSGTVAALAFAGPAELDTGFSGGGAAPLGLTGATAIARDSAGRFVVAGDGAVTRRLAGGGADPAFGGGTPVALGFIARAVAVQPDDKVLVAGDRSGEVVVERLLTSGAPDPSFGPSADGTASFPVYAGAAPFPVQGEAVATDGTTITVAGTATDGASASHAFVARLTSGGLSDTSYAGGGALKLAAGTEAHAVVLTPQGAVLGGSGAGRWLLARATATGALDASFGSGGTTAVDVGGAGPRGVRALALAGTNVIAGGTSGAEAEVARITAAGALDPAFGPAGGGGITRFTFGGTGTEPLSGLTVLADGHIAMAGTQIVSRTPALALARLTAGGVLDPVFAAKGTPPGTKILALPGTNGASGRALVPFADGALAVTGPVGTTTGPDSVLARVGTPNRAPFISSTSVPAALPAGTTATLTAAATDLDADDTTTLTWDFGDGGHATGESVTHAWSAGTYDVAVTATDPGGLTAVRTQRLVATGASGGNGGDTGATAPVAKLVAPTEVAVGDHASLDASGSTGSGLHYRWDLSGKGRFEVDSGTHPSLPGTFLAPGIVPVSVLVTDAAGRTSRATAAVRVLPPQLAALTFKPEHPRVGQKVRVYLQRYGVRPQRSAPASTLRAFTTALPPSPSKYQLVKTDDLVGWAADGKPAGGADDVPVKVTTPLGTVPGQASTPALGSVGHDNVADLTFTKSGSHTVRAVFTSGGISQQVVGAIDVSKTAGGTGHLAGFNASVSGPTIVGVGEPALYVNTTTPTQLCTDTYPKADPLGFIGRYKDLAYPAPDAYQGGTAFLPATGAAATPAGFGQSLRAALRRAMLRAAGSGGATNARPGHARLRNGQSCLTEKPKVTKWEFDDGPKAPPGGGPIQYYTEDQLVRSFGKVGVVVLKATLKSSLLGSDGQAAMQTKVVESVCLDDLQLSGVPLGYDCYYPTAGLTFDTSDPTPDLLVADDNVTLDGAHVGGKNLVVSRKNHSLTATSELGVSVGGAQGTLGGTVLQLPTSGPLEFPGALKKSPKLGGLGTTPTTFRLFRSAAPAQADLQVAVPPPFEAGHVFDVTVQADGSVLDNGGTGLRLAGGGSGCSQIPELPFGPLSATVKLCYDAAAERWLGTGKLIIGGIGIDASDSGDHPCPGGFGFTKSGALDYAGAHADFALPGLPLAPPPGSPAPPVVFLTSVGGCVSLNPFALNADATVSIADLLDVTGCFALVQSEGTPVELAKKIPYCTDEFGHPTNYPTQAGVKQTAIKLSGSVKLAGLKIGGGYAEYRPPSYVAARTGFTVGDPDYVALVGTVGGAFAGTDDWLLDGKVSLTQGIICLFGHCPGVSVQGAVGPRGYAGCGEILSKDIGLYSSYPLNPHLFWDCDDTNSKVLKKGSVIDASLRAATDAFGQAVEVKAKVAAGVPHTVFVVSGVGKAPLVDVLDPSGKLVYHDTGAVAQSPQPGVPNAGIVHSDKLKTTVVYLPKPETGTYTVRTQDNQPGILTGQQLDRLPPLALSASVTGTGAARKLAYAYTAGGGRTVRFVEEGTGVSAPLDLGPARPRAVAAAARATARTAVSAPFTPADAGAGKRRVVALITTADGRTRRQVVASYTAPPRRLPAAPRVTVVRRGTSLTVRWRKVPLAASYDVRVTLAGRMVVRTVYAGREPLRLVVGGAANGVKAKITVTPRTYDGKAGGKATSRPRPLRARPVRLRL